MFEQKQICEKMIWDIEAAFTYQTILKYHENEQGEEVAAYHNGMGQVV